MDDIHLLYLTPYGHDALRWIVPAIFPYKTISYRDKLPPWLERCQQRAYDEPELRESVAQYRAAYSQIDRHGFRGGLHE